MASRNSIFLKSLFPVELTTIDSINESKRLKNSPLAALKAHHNVGYLSHDGKKHN